MQVVANDSRKLSPGAFAIANLICEAPNQARSSRPLFDNCPLSASNGVLGRCRTSINKKLTTGNEHTVRKRVREEQVLALAESSTK